MRHLEFIHKDHFEHNYHKHYVQGKLSLFIDFFWQTKFEKLWHQYPKGFSDVLFPNVGYTYLFNIGTPYILLVENKKFKMNADGFLPRSSYIESYHQPGNVLFGIKFKVSPVIFEKKINFSDYTGAIFPLSYLAEASLLKKIKKTLSFEKRVQLLINYYEGQLHKHEGSLRPVSIVTSILDKATEQNNYNESIEALAANNHVSARTLQRYFLICTGTNSKKSLQVLRIRKAVGDILLNPGKFDHNNYGYYDHSHFYKHLKQFLHHDTLKQFQPHLQLLKSIQKNKAGKNTGPAHT